MIRVVLPAHLRTLAARRGELKVDVEGPATQAGDPRRARSGLPDAARDDPRSSQRAAPRLREILRLRAGRIAGLADDPLPEAVATGAEPFLIVGAMAGG